MSLSTTIVRFSGSLLEPTQRAERTEEWLADLRDSPELGIPASSIALGALTHAVTALPHRFLSGERAVGTIVRGDGMIGRGKWWFLGIATFVLCVITGWQWWLGFSDASHSTFYGREGVVYAFMNVPMRLLFPIVVALLAGSGLATQLSDRFILATRTRTAIRGYLASRIAVVTVSCFLVFFVIGTLTALIAYFLPPMLTSVQIDPSYYGLHDSAAIMAHGVQTSPISALLAYGPVAYAFGVGAWQGMNAAVFALVTVVAVLLIRRRALAMLVPFAIYLLQTILFQMIVPNLAGASFVISVLYPGGLQRYPLSEALVPWLVLGVLALGAAAWLVGTARRNPRMA